MSDVLNVFGDIYNGVSGFHAMTTGSQKRTYVRYVKGKKVTDPICFFDYDGTLVASYKTVPSALPDVPTHEGLKGGVWNYTLQEISTQFAASGTCDIGANYMTESEKTEIDVEFVDSAKLSPYLRFAVNGTVTVDWGDGSATEDVTGISLTTRQDIQHTYPRVGKYTITLANTSGSYAMYGDSAYTLLHSNTGGNASRVYANCVEAVRIGKNCSIDGSAFAYCYSLLFITIPSGVASIGSSAFNGCYSLSSITIPSSVASIRNNAFNGCYSLSSVTIPSGITSIRSNVFSSCSSLSSVTIPSGVTSIDGYAFAYCSSLSSITIPSGVTSIGDSVFNSCYSLSSITIPSGVTSIGVNVFQYCYSISSITIPSGVTSIGNNAFHNCSSISFITIPSGVTNIGNDAFRNCYSLSSITIPSGVTGIGNGAFYQCYSLSSVTIPSGITSIGSNAFRYCSSLSSITIPSGVTNIGNSAFVSCYGMKEYHFESTTPPTLGTTAFTNIQSDCVIYVPRSSGQAVLNAYKSATNWSGWTSYMQEEAV